MRQRLGAAGSRPGRRATNDARPGTGSQRSVSTPLELFFDLCFVVAVAQAAAGLHDLLVERRFADAVIGFVALFFAVWWAWVNVVWFSTGHDSDDVVHRVLTLVQMAGALILAAGVHDAMFDLNLTTT